MTIALLAKHGIELATSAAGRHYTTCPRCSKDRSGAHKGAKVLGITILPDDSIHWGCNHCGWTGPEKGNGARSTKIEITYDYHDADGTLLFQKVRNPSGSKSRFYCRRPDGRGGWINNTKDIAKPLYRLPEVIEAIKAGHPIAIAEGEKDCDNLWTIGFAATCNFDGALDVITSPKGKPKWKAEYSEALRGVDLIVFNDNDPAGYAHADVICKMSHGVAKRVRRLDLKTDWPEIPPKGDISDWLAAGGEHTAEKLRALIAAAPDFAPAEESPPDAKPESVDDTAELEKLARMVPLDYERARKDAGKRLGIARLSLLDTLVKAKRAEFGLNGADGKAGHAIEFPTPELWDHQVEGINLLNEIAGTIGKHIVLSKPEDSSMLALWILHAHLIKRFVVSPKLYIRSATRGCGKSTLLDLLGHLVSRRLFASNITTATAFRLISEFQPTMLIDEVDAFLKENPELRSVINASHRYDGTVPRLVPVGSDYVPRQFKVYCAMALAGIGAQHHTIMDRSIVIDLPKRKGSEPITSLEIGATGHLDDLARRIVRWVADNDELVGKIKPVMPVGLINRTADNWKPLLAIAEAAGGEWPQRARDAAAKLGSNDDAELKSHLELLIGDIKGIFDHKGGDRISSDLLVELLCDLDEPRPWPECGKTGKRITTTKVARLLQPFKITTQQIRFGPDDTRKGYYLSQFKDAFDRLAPSPGGVKAKQRNKCDEMGTSGHFQSETSEPDVSFQKSQKPNNDGICFGVSLQHPPGGPVPSDGSTSASSNGAAQAGQAGLSTRTMRELGEEYQDRTYAAYQECGTSDADYRRPVDAWLRIRLAELGVFREHLDATFERVMAVVFETPEGGEPS